VFDGCSSLISVTIPDSVTSIGPYPFYNCTSLTTIMVGINNATFSSVNGVLFDKTTNFLIQCPGGKAGSYTIPDTVTRLGDLAFAYCKSLTSITIPDSVTRIGNDAFEGCYSLAGLYFWGNIPYEGWYIFYGAGNVTNYFLPGTTNWGTAYGGRPTAMWRLPYPVILDIPPSLGVKTNQYGFRISWATNASVVVEACTSLGIWSPIATNTITMGINPLTDGWTYFSDPNWTNSPARFYRLRSP
jgi:hypothetical protein